LGRDENGVLLYGTNAVGKTSLIRALGVSVIMAQSGMYVPCSKFIYKPYTAIYSRIIGNDNIFKGLSTFAVEMSELRVILKMADSNSLILGDELCSGTETESALSIFCAGLMQLTQKQSSFIFATHFHEILNFEEITKLTSVVTKHMAVYYDRALDCLVYDRKLKDGSGPRIYGLEVCKSLYLEDEFLGLAYSLRNKYFPETKGVLSSPGTVYNARKLKSVLCEKCGINKAEEVHHLQQQKDANDNGFIGSFHKNHPANLQNICQECHDKIHATNDAKTTVRKKTMKGFKTI
jgi:DNA mismatch repair protein MutS